MRLAVYILFFLPAWVLSQTSGLVIDQQTRLPLENVRVVLPDSTMIHTNIAGIFYLPEDRLEGKLTVSHIGYVSQQYSFFDQKKIFIEMLPDPRELTEVQVSATQFSGKLNMQPGNMITTGSTVRNIYRAGSTRSQGYICITAPIIPTASPYVGWVPGILTVVTV